MRENYKINAILENDLEKILKSKGILEDIKAGNLVCFLCGKPLSIDNIGAIHIKDGLIKICCDDEVCYSFK